MNEPVINKKYFSKLISFFKERYKFVIVFTIIAFVLYIILQVYFISKKNKVFSTSIEYNNTFSDKLEGNFQEDIDILSLEKNFFGILALLEKIKIDITKNNFDSANKIYLELLGNNDVGDLYKTAIAIHGSYLFLDQINPSREIPNKLNLDELEIIKFIDNLLLYVDPSFESYEGFKLEILYLLSIVKQGSADKLIIKEESNNLYKLIQENAKISSTIKDRVKKIHEFKTYN